LHTPIPNYTQESGTENSKQISKVKTPSHNIKNHSIWDGRGPHSNTIDPHTNHNLNKKSYSKDNFSIMNTKETVQTKAKQSQKLITKTSGNSNETTLPNMMKNESLKINLIQWNACSLNKQEKIQYLLSHEFNIALIQETWQLNPNALDALNPGVLLKVRREERAGGTLTLLKDIPHSIHKTIQINKDTNIYRILLGRDKYIWLSSIYLSRGHPQQVQLLFKKIYENIPSYEWDYVLIAGDFNVNLRKDTKTRTLLTCLSKQYRLKIIRPSAPTHLNNEIDYLICGNKISVGNHKVLNAPSDHKMISWEVTIPIPDPKPLIKIPNRKLANKITSHALLTSNSSSEFLFKITCSRKALKNNIMLKIKPKKRERATIQKLLEMNSDSDAIDILKDYWNQFNKGMEDQRFSMLSKPFFTYLNKVFKYNALEKRDGSIINALFDDNGSLITSPTEVAENLQKTIKEMQYNEDEPTSINLPFPEMEELKQEEMNSLIANMWHGKAIAFDLVSDILFSKKLKGKTAQVFKDLWRNSLQSLDAVHLKCRLVPLNKKHPSIPTRKDVRPIIIMSPLLKILESILMPQLSTYLIKELYPGQTGFVPGNGIFVNIYRTIERIRKRNDRKQRCFGLFIDFSSAYNTIKHTLLFQKLEPILGEKKVQLLKALYSRILITLGGITVKPNQGVAQGSTISPALFNIYTEGLLKLIEQDGYANMEDILAYADDLLIICDDIPQLRRVIKIIKSWSKAHNLHLNVKKSGIMEFVSRHMKPLLSQNDLIEDIPVVTNYKYLGMRINQKLTMSDQLSYINNRAEDLQRRLSPFLLNSDLDTRKNLWQVFIQPLCEFLLPLYKYETAESRKLTAERIIKKTFKSFLGLHRNTPDSITESLMGYDYKKRSEFMYQVSIAKWKARKERTLFNLIMHPEIQSLYKKPENICRRVPLEFVKYINLTRSICRSCNKINTINHLNTYHKCSALEISEVLDQLRTFQKTRPLGKKHSSLQENLLALI